MANISDDHLYCKHINSANKLECCNLSSQHDPLCQVSFNITAFEDVFVNNWITACGHNINLYSSIQQNKIFLGDGSALRYRYNTCANVPAIAKAYRIEGSLDPNISSAVAPFLPPPASISDDDLIDITSTVTACLTQTCARARGWHRCQDVCSPTRLFTNSTTPDIGGIKSCLENLCNGRFESDPYALPYADADIIGIGVFASYFMQCAMAILLWFWYMALEVRYSRSRKIKVRGKFIDLVMDFHITQCFFSITIQIAAFCQGLFEPDLLKTFLFIPIAINGVFPVISIYLLIRFWKHFCICRARNPDECRKRNDKIPPAKMTGMTLLTVLCWILSSTVYWILYTYVIPIQSDDDAWTVYEGLIYKLSASRACGQYSALAVCEPGTEEQQEAHIVSDKLRIVTPIVWTFSTIGLLVVLADKIVKKRHKSDGDSHANNSVPNAENGACTEAKKQSRIWLIVAVVIFLACSGMQLSLLTFGVYLQITNPLHWSFGQVVAVTVWAPPLLTWIFSIVVNDDER